VAVTGVLREMFGRVSRLTFALALATLLIGMSGTIPASAQAASSVWRATGNEPSWSLTRSARTLTLEMDMGKTRLTVPTPKETPGKGSTRWYAMAQGKPLVITATQEICLDTMTGMPRPEQVTVAYAGRTLKGCGGDPASLLQGREWTVASLAGRPTLPAPRITMTFAEGRVAGMGSCNRYGAGYTLTSEGLSFSKGMSTMMACEPALMEQERTFLELLEKVRRFTIGKDGSLVLLADDGSSIVTDKPR
jgi:heat shock protein HslJ